jgi:phage shock protein PspC (stress-responsive transcriptional regulator)
MTAERIYRSNKEYIIAGVCGGLAQYFKVDPTLVRLIFILLSFGGGSGVLIYLILWLVLPVEPKDSSRQPMQEEKNDNTLKDDNEDNRKKFLGIIFLLLGFTALLHQLMPTLVNWSTFWPIILIVFGLYLLFRKK